jgi:tetratricopeptide (TPR) repeat protein
MTRSRILLGVFLLAVAVAGVYGQVVGHGFVSVDDNDYILKNPGIRDGVTLRGVVWAFSTFHASNWHPITWLSHMLDVELFGFSPGGHHAVSLLIHLVNVLLLFWLLGKATGAWLRSFAVALIFAIHPMNVESVAWVSERKNLLSTLFWLLAAGAYGRYAVSRRLRDYLGTAGLFTLALMAKPMPVTFPVTLLLLDIWPLRRFHPDRRPWWPVLRPLVAEKLPLFALAAIASVVTLAAQSAGGAVRSLGESGLADRFGNALIAYALYLGKAVWPSQLVFFYPFDPSRISLVRMLLSALLLLAVTGAAALLARRAPWGGAGWGWYLVTLLPVIGIVHVGSQSMADRYAYVPLVGIFVIVVWGCAALVPERGRWRPFAAVAATAAVLALGTVAHRQAAHWRSNSALFSRLLEGHMAGKAPSEMESMALRGLKESIDNAAGSPSPRAALNLGLALLGLEQTDQAMIWLNEALRRDPALPEAHAKIGEILLSRGMAAEAAERFSRAIELMPGYGEAHARLGDTLVRLNRPAEAREHYAIAVDLLPDDAKTLNNLGALLANEGDTEAAVVLFRRAVAAQSEYAPAYFNLGRALWQSGLLDEARARLSEAVRLDPASFAEQAATITEGRP